MKTANRPKRLALSEVDPKVRKDVRSGIKRPKVRRLCPGTKLYRFGSSDTSKGRLMKSPWWFGQKDFHKIVHHAIKPGAIGGMGYSGRQALAIKHAWSKVDILVEATVAENIDVFYGQGEHQCEKLPNGNTIDWPGWPDSIQFYLPMLHRVNQRSLKKMPVKFYRKVTVKSLGLPGA